MPARAFFRDLHLPSHAQDLAARESFLLDTYAERRATEQRSWLRSLLSR